MFFPKFWLLPKSNLSLLSFLMLPLTLVWKAGNFVKCKTAKPKDVPIPIICVGNITIGGNGKTPTTLKIQNMLEKAGYATHILSKGYKGRLRGPLKVNEKNHNFLEVGDEPLMMSHYAPTWIAKNRFSGVQAAASNGAEVIIMDDGFQDKSIKKDFSIAVIDTSIGFGNERLIPAGPLREPLSGLDRANLVIKIGDEKDQLEFLRSYPKAFKTTSMKAKFVSRCKPSRIVGKRVIAIAGIGHPKKFFNHVKNLGANIIESRSFPNHKGFRETDLKDIILLSERNKAQLITTEKDFVRIPQKFKSFFLVIKIELELENEKFIFQTISESLQLQVQPRKI